MADPGGDGDASPTGTHSAPKLAILRSKIEFPGSGGEGGTPSPHPVSYTHLTLPTIYSV